MEDRARRRMSPQAAGLVTVIGMVFVMTGIGNVLVRGQDRILMPFVLVGVGMTIFGLVAQRRWFRAAGATPPPLPRAVLGLVAGLAAGTLVYALLGRFLFNN